MTGRWPKAIFYDSKTTLFDWAWSWRKAAELIVEKHGGGVDANEFFEDWAILFEGFQRRAAFTKYADLTEHIVNGLRYAYRMYGIDGNPEEDVKLYLDLQDQVMPFPEVVGALQAQRELGVKIFIVSDVETKYLEMYVDKLQGFKPDFMATSQQAGIHKPNPRIYHWVLRQVGMEPRDVLYCAAPQFDIQGALGAGLKAAWLRREEGRLGQRNITFERGDVLAEYEISNLNELTQIIERNIKFG